MRSWLEAWLPIDGPQVVVDLIWRATAERHVGTGFVVPSEIKLKLAAKLSVLKGHQEKTPRAFVLQGADEPLQNRQAAILSHGAEARPDALLVAAEFETVAPELAAFVAHDVLRRGTGSDERR